MTTWKIHFNEMDLAHILTLCAAHDTKMCRRCDDIVTQILYQLRAENETVGGWGGAPPTSNGPRDSGHNIPSLEDLPF